MKKARDVFWLGAMVVVIAMLALAARQHGSVGVPLQPSPTQASKSSMPVGSLSIRGVHVGDTARVAMEATNRFMARHRPVPGQRMSQADLAGLLPQIHLNANRVVDRVEGNSLERGGTVIVRTGSSAEMIPDDLRKVNVNYENGSHTLKGFDGINEVLFHVDQTNTVTSMQLTTEVR